MDDQFTLGIAGNVVARGPHALYPSLESFPTNVLLMPSIMTAYEESQITRREAVRQARQTERQSETIRGGLDRKVNTLVGADLFPRLTPDWRSLGMDPTTGPKWAADFARLGEQLFKSWAIDRRKIADAEGHNTFGGLMWLAMRNVAGPDGESFGIIHYDVMRQRRLGTPWATTVTVLDPQRVGTPPEYSGDPDVVDGKLIDEYGRMLGFYFNKMPRGPAINTDLTYGFCPRENGVGRPMGWHYFAKHRGAAQRGVTSLISILKRSRMLDQFDGAQLGAAIVAAAMATYIKTKGTPEEARENLAPAGGDADENRLMAGRFGFYDRMKLRIGKQRIPVLPLEDEIMISAADRSAGDPTAFRNAFMRDFASALNTTAESLSLDYSQVNYSSARAALVDIWRGVITERSMFCSSAPSLIVEAVLEECIVKGWMKDVMPDSLPPFNQEREAYTRCTWTGPAMGWVDPYKEAQAAALRINPTAPLSTLTREAASQGVSFEEIVDERAREQDALRQAGLLTEQPVADTMPRLTGTPGGPPADDNTGVDAPPPPPAADNQRRGEG